MTSIANLWLESLTSKEMTLVNAETGIRSAIERVLLILLTSLDWYFVYRTAIVIPEPNVVWRLATDGWTYDASRDSYLKKKKSVQTGTEGNAKTIVQ